MWIYVLMVFFFFFFFSSRRRHTRSKRDWSSDVCSSDLLQDRAQAGDGVRADGLRVPGGGPQFPGEVERHPLQVPDHAEIRSAGCRGLPWAPWPSRRIRPAAPARSPGPARPAGPVLPAWPVTWLPAATPLVVGAGPFAAGAGPFLAGPLLAGPLLAGPLLASPVPLAAIGWPGRVSGGLAVQFVTCLPGAVPHLLAGTPGGFPRGLAGALLAVPYLTS